MTLNCFFLFQYQSLSWLSSIPIKQGLGAAVRWGFTIGIDLGLKFELSNCLLLLCDIFLLADFEWERRLVFYDVA